MYCKYCGNRLNQDTTKCSSCGAKINLNDGGQSFFDDNELSAWQTDGISYGVQTGMPKTEMREASGGVSDFDEVLEKALEYSKKNTGANTRAKKKLFNISSSNKLIVFCISSALAIVLLVVAIIAVLSGGDDKSEKQEKQVKQNDTTAYVQSENGKNNATGKGGEPAAPVEEDPAETAKAFENKQPVNNVVIMRGTDVVKETALLYIIGNVEYVAITDILQFEGYKDGTLYESEDGTRTLYEHATDTEQNRQIDIQKDTKNIWIGSIEAQQLKYTVYEIDGVIYVPAEDFLNKIGYKYAFNRNTNTLTYNK